MGISETHQNMTIFVGLRSAFFVLLAMQSRSFRIFSTFKSRYSVFAMKESTELKSLLSTTPAQTKFVFVGGKGGVGKTSTSSSIGLHLSDNNLRTLVVSTDPAHSLGDALDIDLSNGKVTKVTTEDKLWALEIDVDDAMEQFKQNAQGLDAASLSSSLGVPKELIESLGLNDLASIFTNPPPGIDEIIALIKVFEYANEKDGFGGPRFERIVIDTAPTGHTIRLLQLPAFLDSVTGKLIKFRSKLTSAVSSFKNLFGGDSASSSAAPSIQAMDKLEDLQKVLLSMKSSLKDVSKTQFVVVTIPTTMAVEESKRLISSLQGEDIKISSLICNQIVAEQAGSRYVETRKAAQRRCINALSTKIGGLSESTIEITEVPYVDTEILGLYGLRYFASLAHPPKPRSASNPIASKKLTVFGGKGGVGKTTSAASWALQLSEAGLRTLVVSTDPAHSLGDALQERLTGTPRCIDTSASGGQLWAMEIDPVEALKEFQDIVKSSMDSSDADGSVGGMLGGMGMPDIKGDLMDMLSGADDPPPGTDEVVAMTKVVTYLERGWEAPDGTVHKFDRVVLDTAPTGHTLRMLQLPVFLQQLTKKLRSVRDKVGSMGGMMGMMGGMMGSQSRGDAGRGAAPSAPANDRLEDFEGRMKRLEELLHDDKSCEFTIVTIPTELATAESCRLLTSLQIEDISVRRLIVNQVLPTLQAQPPSASAVEDASPEGMETAEAAAREASEAYLRRLRRGQTQSLAELQRMAEGASVPLIQVPYFDMEVRTVYGLRVISGVIFQQGEKP